jgi:hypothetical protein
MTDSDFRALVRRMRAAQRRYFARRDNLDECKQLERAVDEEAREQPGLFDVPKAKPAVEMPAVPTALERAERLCGQWQRTAPPLPPDALHLLKRLAWRIVLDAALPCGARASVKARPMSVRNEATECGVAIRHHLLCAEGESVCLRCDGEGCPVCHQIGVVALRKDVP